MSDVSFGGESFAAAESIGLMALMRFAHVARSGTDANDMAGLAAMYELLEQCIEPSDWERFQQTAMRTRATGDDLMRVVKDVIQAASARPTGRSSDSSDGPTATAPSSESSDAPLRVVRRLESEGRPDLALMVTMAQEAKASVA